MLGITVSVDMFLHAFGLLRFSDHAWCACDGTCQTQSRPHQILSDNECRSLCKHSVSQLKSRSKGPPFRAGSPRNSLSLVDISIRGAFRLTDRAFARRVRSQLIAGPCPIRHQWRNPLLNTTRHTFRACRPHNGVLSFEPTVRCEGLSPPPAASKYPEYSPRPLPITAQHRYRRTK